MNIKLKPNLQMYQNLKQLKIAIRNLRLNNMIYTYAVLIRETKPKNINNKTKKRLDQTLFNP